MTRTLRLALAQINSTVGDIPGNTAKVLEYLERARDAQADLVAFPELAITGYPPEDLLFKSSFVRDNVEAMKQVVAASKGIAVVVGFVHLASDIYNAAALGYDGELIDTYQKIHLPNYGVFDEDRYFRPGDTCPVYVINGVSIGLGICEDIWYPVGPLTVQRNAGAELIININASPFHAGKGRERDTMLSNRGSDNQVFVAYLNCVGGQDELVFDGGSVVHDMAGQLVARGPSFEEDLVIVDLDLDKVRDYRQENVRPNQEDSVDLGKIGKSKIIQVSNHQPRERSSIEKSSLAPCLSNEEEVYRALVLGTGDYLRKTGFAKALVGLSGGVDSALTATVAVDALGRENVVGIAMPSRYSTEGSISDAKELADNLGIDLWMVPIEPAHVAFTDMLEPHFRDTQPNVAEENVQARIRGNILMTISNKFGWMVLTTGNKSEMAMGYATLYGDMAGGFAVIKDVPKTLVYQLCQWRNQHGDPHPVIPEAIINKPPSAELKEGQLDQDTLPPYEVLDPVVKAYVEEDCSYQDMVDKGFDPQVVRQVIASVDRNEYKRRQAPPGVKITPRAFGKDRRLPIVNRYRQT